MSSLNWVPIFLIVLPVIIVFGIAMPYPSMTTGTITGIKDTYQADGYTYTNFTVSVKGFPTQYVVVDCNYYHVGSTMQFSVLANIFMLNRFIENADPVQGCVPSPW